MIKPFRNKLNIISPEFYDRIWFFNELTLYNTEITKDKYYALASLLTLEKTDISLDLAPRDYVKESVELTFNVAKLLKPGAALVLIKELNTFHRGQNRLEWLEEDILSFYPDFEEHKVKTFLWNLVEIKETYDNLTVEEFLELKNYTLNNKELELYLINKYVESLITVLSVTRPINFKFEVDDAIRVFIEYYEDLTFEEIKELETKQKSLGYLEELVLLLYNKGELLLSTLQKFKLTSGFAYTFESYETEERSYIPYRGKPELIHGYNFNKCTLNPNLRLFESIPNIKSGEPVVEVDLLDEAYYAEGPRSPYEKYFIPKLNLGVYNHKELKEGETFDPNFGPKALDMCYSLEVIFAKCSKMKNTLNNTNLPKIFEGKTEVEITNDELMPLEFYLNYHTTKLAEEEYFSIQADLIEDYPNLLEQSKFLRTEIINEILSSIDHLNNELELKETDNLGYLKEFYNNSLEKDLNFSEENPWEYGNFWEEVAKRLIAKTEEDKEGFTQVVLENLVDTLLDSLEKHIKISEALCNGSEVMDYEERTILPHSMKLNYLLANTDEDFFENIFLKNIIKAYYSNEIYDLFENYYAKEAYSEEEFMDVVEDIVSTLIKYGYSAPSVGFVRKHFEEDFGLIVAYLHETFFNTLAPFITELYETLEGKHVDFGNVLKEKYGKLNLSEYWPDLYQELETIVEGD